MQEIILQPIRSQWGRGAKCKQSIHRCSFIFRYPCLLLPKVYKTRLLQKKDRRISPAGIVIIKSQEARTQETNREKALARLKELIKETMEVRKSRRPTSQPVVRRRSASNPKAHAQTKSLRKRPGLDD